jgi:hypothetical protein
MIDRKNGSCNRRPKPARHPQAAVPPKHPNRSSESLQGVYKAAGQYFNTQPMSPQPRWNGSIENQAWTAVTQRLLNSILLRNTAEFEHFKKILKHSRTLSNHTNCVRSVYLRNYLRTFLRMAFILPPEPTTSYAIKPEIIICVIVPSLYQISFAFGDMPYRERYLRIWFMGMSWTGRKRSNRRPFYRNMWSEGNP